MADNIALLVDRENEVLGQVKDIRKKINLSRGHIFNEEICDAFMRVSDNDFFWFDIASQPIGSILYEKLNMITVELKIETLINLAELFARVIDFKSPKNANHSYGVAASAEAMAKLVGFSDRECQMMRMAGYLHDLGKLAIPLKILEKPGPLEDFEFNLIKSHPYYTFRILEKISEFDLINAWASFHHERLDGTGYPFHLSEKDLPLGSQIMAVADIFTAISEDRPYRQGMNKEEVIQVLLDMSEQRAINSSIVRMLIENYDEINEYRVEAQNKSAGDFEKILAILK